MERLSLDACKREVGKTVSKKLRKEGQVPAILYGVGREPVAIAVNTKEFEAATNTHAGWNVMLDLTIDKKDNVLARISDYQSDVLTRDFTHVDFQVLDINKKILVEVPIKLLGTPVGVKEGGILEVTRRVLELKCLPTNIPEHIDIDVSALDLGDNIHVNDVKLPEGVVGAFDVNFSIASVVAPTKEEVPETAVEGGVEGVAAVEGAAAPAEGVEAPAVGDKGSGKHAEPKK